MMNSIPCFSDLLFYFVTFNFSVRLNVFILLLSISVSDIQIEPEESNNFLNSGLTGIPGLILMDDYGEVRRIYFYIFVLKTNKCFI